MRQVVCTNIKMPVSCFSIEVAEGILVAAFLADKLLIIRRGVQRT
jgi:hypothetical protein